VTLNHPVDVAFEALLAMSSDIVVAEPLEPAAFTESVPVVEDGKTYPPYAMQVLRFRVREVLYGDAKAGTVIEVVPAHEARALQTHRLNVTRGMTRSLYTEQYQPQSSFGAQEPRILFLSTFASGPRYTEVVEGAAEGLARREIVTRWFKERKVSDDEISRRYVPSDALQLVLTSDKPRYRRGEPIRLTLRLENRTQTPITLKGILPLRNAANPPHLDITAANGTAIRIYPHSGEGIPKAIYNDQPIVVPAKEAVTLLDLDLAGLPASIRGPRDTHFMRRVERLGAVLQPGRYELVGRFLTQFPAYAGASAALVIDID
jgi:hypothetical protein